MPPKTKKKRSLHPPLSPYARMASLLETLDEVSLELQCARSKVVAGDGFSRPLQLLTDAAIAIETRLTKNAGTIKRLHAKSETKELSPEEIRRMVGWLGESLELSLLVVSIRREEKELDKVRAVLPKVVTAIKALAKSAKK